MQDGEPLKFMLPVVNPYGGTRDSMEHLDTFRSWMGALQSEMQSSVRPSPSCLSNLQKNGFISLNKSQ